MATEQKYGGVNFKDNTDYAGKPAKDKAAANLAAQGSSQLQAAIAEYKRTGNYQEALKNASKGGVAQSGSDLGRAMQAKRGEMMQNLYNFVNGPDEGNRALSPEQQAAKEARIRESDRQIAEYDAKMNGELHSNDISSESLQNALRTEMYADPESGTLMATDQVRSNPLMSGMFGQGGIQDQRQADERNLTKTAYDWNAQDETAFGTAAGNINRQYGAEQGNLARALSSRGFGSANSGVAESQFSGLQGNTSDRLAAAQQNLANNRMQVGLQRLTAARNAVNQAQGMAQGAVNDQYNRNMVGIGRGDKQIANNWQMGQDQLKQQNTEWQQEQDSNINWGKIGAGVVAGGGSAILGNFAGGATAPRKKALGEV